MATATLNGSHGQIVFNPSNGIINHITDTSGNSVEYYGENPDHAPVYIHVAEWKKYYGKTIEADQTFDILDFGYFMANGEYEGPALDWREEMGLQGKAPLPAIKQKIAIIIEGGILQNVLASEDLEVAIVEWDKEIDADRKTEIFPESFGLLYAMPPEVNHPDLNTIIEKLNEKSIVL